MVSIFFTVSGFVLSHRFIQKMQAGELESMYRGLTSVAYRRALRLFLPSFASCTLAFVCASLGLIKVPTRIKGVRFHHGPAAFLQYIDRESNPWSWDMYMEGFYNPQLWSIALEYRGSLVVFLVILELARTRLAIRLAIESAITIHAFVHRRWDIALFVAGMLVAEMDVAVRQSTLASKFMRRRVVKMSLVICLIVGIWLTGYPRDHALESWGYMTLSQAWPHGGYRRRFWLGMGSIMIVAPLPFLTSMQALFEARLARYFGRISFALYLIHGLGNRTIGTFIVRATWGWIGTDGELRYAACFAVASLVYFPIIVWWSDMFWRAFDMPTTRFAKWVESKCTSDVYR